MFDTKMAVQIFRGEIEIGAGQLLPNGAELAFCPDNKDFELLQMHTDTNAVEDRIPMTFMLNDQAVSDGELYYSGEYICLCPDDREMDILHGQGSAKLFLDTNGTQARLEVCSKSH